MPLNNDSWEHVSGWPLLHRQSVAAGWAHRVANSQSVHPAELLVSDVVAMLIVGFCLMLAFFSPVGRIRSSPMLGERAIGGLCDAPEDCV